ncbi:MAG: hypothetical protein NC396_06855 [Bacteroides sp.]|nr:hypothetical protein [Bacteroides sp.]MCM1086072.1 hypothetical protein [Bacteroides sp.]
MKKCVLLLAACVPFVMFSCKESENGDGEKGGSQIAGSDGKTLVAKMTVKGSLTSAYVEDEYGYSYSSKTTTKADLKMNFSYSDGVMKKLTASGDYSTTHNCTETGEGESYKHHSEDNASGNGNMTFSYKGDVVSVEISGSGKVEGKEVYDPDEYDENESYSESGSMSGNYTLNMEKGAAVSGQGTIKLDNESYSLNKIKYEYDNAGQLVKIYYDGDYNEDRVEFEWKNGNIVNVGYYYNDDYKSGKKHHSKANGKFKAAKAGSMDWSDLHVEYSDKENNSNIDFAYLVFSYGGMLSYEQFVGVFGFLGKTSKNLPAKVSYVYEDDDETYEDVYAEIEYTFYDNGNVKRVKITSPLIDEDGNGSVTIDLEY